MEALIPIIVQIIGGGAGGNVIGQLAKSMSMGSTGNTITGVIGGVAGTWLAGMVPGLDGIIGSMASGGGLDVGALVGNGVTGLAGGGILTAVAGFVKNNVMKS